MRPMLAAGQAADFKPPEPERLVSGTREPVDTSTPAVLPLPLDGAVALEPTQCAVDGAAGDMEAAASQRSAERVPVRGRASQLFQDQPVDHPSRIRRLHRPCASR